jgi:hypothetical protein
MLGQIAPADSKACKGTVPAVDAAGSPGELSIREFMLQIREKEDPS